MKNRFLTGLLILCMVFILPGCGEPEPNIPDIPEDEEGVMVSDYETYEWLAAHWGASLEDWLVAAENDGYAYLESWLRDSEEYDGKCWTVESARETLDISVPYTQPQPDNYEDCEKVAEELCAKLMEELFTENENFSFCFRDVKNYEVTLEWNDKYGWVCRNWAEVKYDGIILPIGASHGNYHSDVFGHSSLFALEFDGSTCRLVPLVYDALWFDAYESESESE